ncbi:putative signal peptide peptidase SppA [Acropora palmata]|uniref:putative signal peptide peptidase SppA n=1 Tax=Acropora palmata TaxID=6131 RepID=UPI003DA116BE
MSAAYWLASACKGIFATSSAFVGSIGTFQVHIDASKFHQESGIIPQIFRAGKFKAAGAHNTALTDEQARDVLAEVNEVNERFLAFISEQRPGVARESMEGQVFSAPRAVKAGLIDEEITNHEVLVDQLNRLS